MKMFAFFGYITTKLVKIIQALYYNNKCQVIHNSTLSPSFSVHTGVRQGCWLALNGKPVLFWKGISGLKCPCFLLYACERRWESFEFRAVPILLRKLSNISLTVMAELFRL